MNWNVDLEIDDDIEMEYDPDFRMCCRIGEMEDISETLEDRGRYAKSQTINQTRSTVSCRTGRDWRHDGRDGDRSE